MLNFRGIFGWFRSLGGQTDVLVSASEAVWVLWAEDIDLGSTQRERSSMNRFGYLLAITLAALLGIGDMPAWAKGGRRGGGHHSHRAHHQRAHHHHKRKVHPK